MQILVIGLIVVAAGEFYYKRQIPVYQATAKLKIIRQPSRSGSSADSVSVHFEDDQLFYNTQFNLLTTQLDWAKGVLDRAAYRILKLPGVSYEKDPAGAGSRAVRVVKSMDDHRLLAGLGGPGDAEEFSALSNPSPDLRRALDSVRKDVLLGMWGLNEDSFLSGVRAAPIPSTYLAKLSFEARDPAVAVFFVNLYAELYREVSTKERAAKVENRLDDLARRLDGLTKRLKGARKERADLRRQEPELGPGQTVNVPQQEADAISTKINELETDEVLKQAEEQNVLAVLATRKVRVIRTVGVPVRLELAGEDKSDGTDGGEASLHKLLGTDPTILGLPVLQSDDNVLLHRQSLGKLDQERVSLLADLTPENSKVQKVVQQMKDESARLGDAVETALEHYFESRRETADAIEKLKVRLKVKQNTAHALHKVYSRDAELSEEIESLQKQQSEQEDKINLLNGALSKSKEAQDSGMSIQVIAVERAARLVDAEQIRPKTTIVFFFTFLAAVFLAFGSAFLVEILDDSIKTKEDFERLIAVPDIGFIPRIPTKDGDSKDTVAHDRPRSQVAEAFRTVRTGILFSRRDEEIRRFLITSAGEGEGKTTVAVNLGIIMAQAGRGRVLLLDADLRRPRVHSALGVDNSQGLTNCLVGEAKLADVVRDTRIPGLFVLPSGPIPPNPADLLGGHRMKEIIAEAGETFAKVILDTPPLVAVTDTCLLAPEVEGVFLVISFGKTSWRLIARAKEALKGVGASVTGAILNNVRSRYRGYRYGYGYGGYHATHVDEDLRSDPRE